MAKNQNPYRSATIKELKKMIKSLSDDGEIIMQHGSMDGKPYTMQMQAFFVEDGVLHIEN